MWSGPNGNGSGADRRLIGNGQHQDRAAGVSGAGNAWLPIRNPMVAICSLTRLCTPNNSVNGNARPSRVALGAPALSSTARCRMAFRNEVVSDDDIDRYNLPFPKGGGRWWTRDAERDYYLWGGITGNPAYESQEYGVFSLYIQKYSIGLN